MQNLCTEEVVFVKSMKSLGMPYLTPYLILLTLAQIDH